jgi:hypothetical protein
MADNRNNNMWGGDLDADDDPQPNRSNLSGMYFLMNLNYDVVSFTIHTFCYIDKENKKILVKFSLRIVWKVDLNFLEIPLTFGSL